MSEAGDMTATRKRHVALWAALTLGGLAVALSLGGWAGRTGLATGAYKSWCGQRGWTCTGRITELGLHGLAAEDIAIRTARGEPLAIPVLRANYDWPGPFRLRMLTVEADRPVLRGELDASGLGFFGLESLLATDGSSGPQETAHIPSLMIRQGEVRLSTGAGEIAGQVESAGRPFENGQASLTLMPASLSEAGNDVSWKSADAFVVFDGGTATGEVTFDIDAARLDDMRIGRTGLRATLSGSAGDLVLDWAVSSETLTVGSRSLNGLSASGSARFAGLASVTAEAALDALAAGAITAEFDAAMAGPVTAGRTELTLDLAAGNEGLAGPLAMHVTGLGMPEGRMGTLAVTGVLSLTGSSGGTPARTGFAGSAITRSAGLTAETSARLVSALAMPEPFAAHGDRLKALARAAFSDFEAGVHFEASHDGTAFMLSADRPTVISSASGLTASIEPVPGQPWLAVSPGGTMIAGVVSAGGGGFPSLSGRIIEAGITGASFTAIVSDAVLSRWTVGGRSLWARVGTGSVGFGDRLRAEADGEIGLGGDMPGAFLGDTRLFGAVRAVEGDEGWRVETAGRNCVGFSSAGLTAGTLAFEPVGLSLCPEGGRFMRTEDGRSVGRLVIGDLDLPFRTGDAEASLVIGDAVLEWFTGDGFRFDVAGSRFALPVRLGEQTLTLDAATLNLSVSAGEGPVAITANLGRTVFSGTLVPLEATAGAFAFRGATTPSGLTGEAAARGVRLADPGDDPAFHPLVSEVMLVLAPDGATLSGRMSGEATGRTVATASLEISLPGLDGAGRIALEPLEFRPGGLQPYDLSERLRGVLTNANGLVEGKADFVISGGEVSGTGDVAVTGLSFDTVNVGSVRDVTGTIHFSDLLAVETPPGQTVTIGEINPGLPLQDGLLRFQLLGPAKAQLEEARWPFAGGTLQVLPTLWDIGAPKQSVSVAAENIELSDLVEVLAVPDLQATGTVSGAFPIEIEGANVYVRNARLKADDKGGTLAYTGRATEAAAQANEFAEYAFEALQDLRFSVMEIGADGNLIGDILVSAEITGSNPDVLGGAEFAFSINVDSKLSQLLQSIAAAPTRTYVSEALEADRLAREAEARGAGENEQPGDGPFN